MFASDRNVFASAFRSLIGSQGRTQDLCFALERRGKLLCITDPTGGVREVSPPWQGNGRFTAARIEFNRLTSQPVANDSDCVELTEQALTLGRLLFETLFDETCLALLHEAMLGDAPPAVTIQSDDEGLLSLPWELVWHDGSFLVRDSRLDLARSTLAAPDWPTTAGAPVGPFKLVVNVSAPEGSSLSYEIESYRITRALTASFTRMLAKWDSRSSPTFGSTDK